MKAFSIDFETLSLKHNASLLSVGVVVFDPNIVQSYKEMHDTCHTLSMTIDISYQNERYGRHVCPETANWWIGQNQEARDAVFNTAGVEFGVAIRTIHSWITGYMELEGADELWSYGAASDHIWFESACDALRLKYPFSYKKIRCLRTVAAELEVECPDVPQAINHHSLCDALVQAMWVQRCRQRTNYWRNYATSQKAA